MTTIVAGPPASDRSVNAGDGERALDIAPGWPRTRMESRTVPVRESVAEKGM